MTGPRKPEGTGESGVRARARETRRKEKGALIFYPDLLTFGGDKNI